MATILTILATAFITWVLAYEGFYSPKARIKRLRKEIYTISSEIGKLYTNDSVVDSLTLKPYENAIHKKEKMINVLLDYHFDPEEDQEYIEENRPENRK